MPNPGCHFFGNVYILTGAMTLPTFFVVISHRSLFPYLSAFLLFFLLLLLILVLSPNYILPIVVFSSFFFPPTFLFCYPWTIAFGAKCHVLGRRRRRGRRRRAVCVPAVLYNGYCWKINVFLNFLCIIVRERRAHSHCRTPQYKKGFPGLPDGTPWSDAIGWLGVTYGYLWTPSLRYGSGNVLQKSQNYIASQPLKPKLTRTNLR